MTIEPCLNLKLRQADRILTSHYNSYLSELGIKITQFSVLRSLWYMKQSSQQELERVLLVDQATLTRSLQALVREGYVTKTADSVDRRIMLCSLSDSGKALYKRAEKLWKQAQQSVENKLGSDTAKQILEVSSALTHMNS